MRGRYQEIDLCALNNGSRCRKKNTGPSGQIEFTILRWLVYGGDWQEYLIADGSIETALLSWSKVRSSQSDLYALCYTTACRQGHPLMTAAHALCTALRWGLAEGIFCASIASTLSVVCAHVVYIVPKLIRRGIQSMDLDLNCWAARERVHGGHVCSSQRFSCIALIPLWILMFCLDRARSSGFGFWGFLQEALSFCGKTTYGGTVLAIPDMYSVYYCARDLMQLDLDWIIFYNIPYWFFSCIATWPYQRNLSLNNESDSINQSLGTMARPPSFVESPESKSREAVDKCGGFVDASPAG